MPSPFRQQLTTLGFVCAAVIGCSSLDACAGVIRDDREPQAYLNLAASSKYASVGRLDVSRDQPGFIGSGTLIAPDWVLTAAHLMDNATAVTFHIDNHDYTASNWFTNSKWDGDPLHGSDIALVHLSTSASDSITPATLNKGKGEFGQTTTFVGYGRTGVGSTGATSYDGLKRAGQNMIDGQPGKLPKTYETKLKGKSKIFIVDFDNPAQPGDNITGDPTPLDLEYLISFGDSGGGAFIDTPTGTLLAGIISYGEAPTSDDDSGYGDVTGQTRVSSYVSWIKKTMKRNASQPQSGAGRVLSPWPAFGTTPKVRELFIGPMSDADLDPTLIGTTSPRDPMNLGTISTPVPEPACVYIAMSASTMVILGRRRSIAKR